MKGNATLQTPLEIDRVESLQADTDSVRLRLSGRWLDPSAAGEEELLVVQVEGRRHRFPAHRERKPDLEAGLPLGWSATFTLPAWAEPRYDGQAALWLGNAVIPVPPPVSSEPPPPEPQRPEPSSSPGAPRASEPPPPASEPSPRSGQVPAAVPGKGTEPPRSGPLADLLLKETVAALHAELERRTAEAVQIRGALADAQSDLEARTAMQTALESTHLELRHELERLMGAVERQRSDLEDRVSAAELGQAERSAKAERARAEGAAEAASLREQLAGTHAAFDRRAAEISRLRADLAGASVARDAAVGEAAGLRAELERLGTELAVTRERVRAEEGDLGEASRLLADARALSEQLTGG